MKLDQKKKKRVKIQSYCITFFFDFFVYNSWQFLTDNWALVSGYNLFHVVYQSKSL